MRLVTEEKVAIEGDRLLVVGGERLMMSKVEFILLAVAGSLFALRTKDHQGRNTAAGAAVRRKERI